MVTEAPAVGTGVEHYAPSTPARCWSRRGRDRGRRGSPQELKGIHANPIFEILMRPDDGSPDRTTRCRSSTARTRAPASTTAWS